MLTDRGFSHMLANIILEKDPTNEAALKMLQQPKNRAVVNGITYDLDKVSEESVTEIWADDVVSRLTSRAPDAGESPAQQALFTPEAGSAAGKLPTPTPRR